MAEHKHAAVLRAIADGKKVQWFTSSEQWETLCYGVNPLTNPQFQWRIKPEPKPDVVLYQFVESDGNSGGLYSSRGNVHNVRYVFDGENPNKLKSAEVLP